MPRRTPDIFMSPKQLEQRAKESKDKARLARSGEDRDRHLQDARSDQTMAEMKRLVGDDDNEAPAR